MRAAAIVPLLTMVLITTASCSGGGLFKQYEYEEDMYLALDGSATLYVNSSTAALGALRGTTFDTSPDAVIDRDAVRAYYTTLVSNVDRRPTTSRRNGRRYVHVRMQIPDVTRLGTVVPFNWSSYDFRRVGELYVFKQAVGAAAGHSPANAGWEGDEIVAFRLHLPSKVDYYEPGHDNLKRGNILVWEQSLADRLAGVPLALEARMETQSILYRTLWLFGATILAVAVLFAIVIWLVVRKGRARDLTVRR
jgi:hypothetical protein